MKYFYILKVFKIKKTMRLFVKIVTILQKLDLFFVLFTMKYCKDILLMLRRSWLIFSHGDVWSSEPEYYKNFDICVASDSTCNS